MKSAWGILTDPSQNSRYPTTQAVLINQGGACSPATMGLVGLHSIHKTVSQPQFTWATHGVACVISGDVAQALDNSNNRLLPIGTEMMKGVSAPIGIYEYRPD